MRQTCQIFFPRNITNEMGYQVKPQSPIPNSRPPSHYTFPQPTSPKSPVNFVRYHQQQLREYPPIEVEYGFPHATSRSRSRLDRNFRSLDFEVGLREDGASSYSEAPPYHQYPEEDPWEERGHERRSERDHPPMVVLEAWSRAEGTNPPPRPVTNLHPYVGALSLTVSIVRANHHNCRSPLSRLLLVSFLESNERAKF